ncbi:3-phosphoglycerate dehydrogenase [Acidiphilium multivorum]|uniref:NAD(P)-dependent oxidoreductase n=1 Tax=Acidiphilium multivorum TaxID=62140 RepID=UPI001F4C166B|nr:NAD(P)-dependent oxidoreductase [Acidiphilium multivorum]UNC13953.1 3-phosphoglycerate dehydrogenase [Acidiphilium multivorum]
MAEIVISEFMDDAAVAQLAARADTLYARDLVDRPDDLRAALADARALIVRNRTKVDAALLDAAPKVTCVGRLGVGLDNIDLDACRKRGVTVYPATGANDDAVAEYVVVTAMILLRPAFLGSTAVAAGDWPRDRAIGREIAGKRAGLIGFGRTARKTAVRLAALGMEILAHDPVLKDTEIAAAGAKPISLMDLLASSDLVTLHIPLTEATRNLIDTKALAAMKQSAVLVNAARGGVLDEAALASALKAGSLAGAALDVFSREPLDAAAASVFRDVPNLILTPHIAGVTTESNVRVSDLIATIIIRELGIE